MKKFKSKLFAVITVMALFFTNFVPTLSELTAYAAATNVTVTSMANTGGRISGSNPFGVAQDIQYIYISSQTTPATCLEFNTTCRTTNSYTKHTNQAYWDKMSDSQKKAIRLIMHYGYYNDRANHHTQAYFDATQLLVWEVTGYQWYNNHAALRTFVMDENASNAGSSSCSTPLINYYSGSSDTRAKYNEILTNIDAHFDHTTGSYINWYSNTTPKNLAKANPLEMKWNAANNRFQITMRRVKSVWDRYKWTDVLRAAGFTVESKQYSGDMYDYTISTRDTNLIEGKTVVVDTKTNTSTNNTFAVYDNTSVTSDNAQGWGGGQTIGVGGNSYLFAAMAFHGDVRPPSPEITVKKIVEGETIANVPNYSGIKGSLYFALQAKTGSTWSYVYFTSSGNRYTYSSVASGGDPYQIKLDDKGEFILANLPYGTYRLYESWRGSPTGLKSAGLQNPPSSYLKEFTVPASSASTLQINNETIKNGSLEIDKKVVMADENTPIPDSAYTSLTFTIKDKSGKYLVLDTVDAAAGTYKYKSTTATAASATKIKLGTSTHKAVVTDIPIDTGYVVEETCGNPRFRAYSDTVTVSIVAETSADATFTNYEVYGSIKGTKVDKNDPDKKLVGAVYGLFKEGTTEFNGHTAYKVAGSNIDGVFTFSKVPYGNYIIREITAPKGYKLSTEQKNVSITSQGQTVTFQEEDPPINIWLSKKSVTGNAELAGAKMQLRTSTGSVIDSWTSGSSAHLVSCVAAGSYVLHEEAAPDGYVVVSDIEFVVNEDGSVSGVNTTSTADGEPIITMTDDITRVTVYKKDITNDEELAGAKLQIKDSAGKVVDEWTSTNEPHKINGKLIAGATYTLHEELAPDGYVVAKDIAFTVDPTGKVTEVTMTDDVTKITVSKKTITGSDELVGAKMQLLDSNGNVVDEWISTSEPHDIYGKLVAGQTYTLHEEYAPNGYVVANDITFVVSEDGSVDVVEMRDDTTKVQISKKTITGDDELAGAKLQVKDSDGNVVDEWTSTDKPHMIEGKLVAGEKYTLHEEYAPNGYVIANDIEFTVSADGSVDVVEMRDDTTKVRISKKTITGDDELAGAKLQVKDSAGNVVDEWTSTDKPHMIEGKLVAGEKYTLHEEYAPNGYVIANDIEFTVSADGSVDVVEMRDDTTKVKISKQDITNGKELAGAKLQVKDSDGNIVDEWTSSNTPHYIEGKLTAGQTYTLHEEYAPNGYVIANDIEFTVSADGSVDVVEMRDDTTKVRISKKTITGDDELAGAKLQVKDSAGNVVDEWTSTDTPHYIEGKLTAGETYTLHEEYAPNGYVIASDITFVVSEDGSVDTVTMKDDRTKVAVSKKDLTTGKELAGAELVVYDDKGNEVDRWITTDRVHYVEALYTAGKTYTLHEEYPADGYSIAKDVQFTVSDDGRIDVAVMIDDTTKVQISKQSITDGSELAGAKLQVKDSDGNVVDEWTSTDKPHMIEGKLVAGQTYTLHEEVAPDGYVVANDIEFTVSSDGSIDVVEMIDDIAKGTVSVQKTTEGMLNIEGIDLVLSGVSFLGLDVNMTATTDENGIAVFEGVPVGTYTITEEESTVPYGYLIADPIEGVEVIYAQQTDVEIFNAEMTGSIAVSKTTEGMVNLESIEFILSGVTDTGRELELKALTDEAGAAIFENVPIGTYTITENGETVPYGYLTADPIEGVEVIYAQQTDVEIFNAEMTGSIAVSKTTEGMVNLEGIEFVLSGVTDTGREIELIAATDETGLAVFENVPVGTYAITENEETVPYGYLTADPIEGVEVVYAQQTDVEVFNIEMTGSIRVQKKTEGMKDLEGIGFKLSGTTDTGREISLYVKTDKDGLAVFEGVPVGTYTLTEDGQTVPKGYLIARAVEGVEVVYAQQTDVTVVNDKVPVNESPKTGDTAPYEMVVVCTLIAAAALLLRKRTDNFVD